MVGYRVSIIALFFFAALISPMGFAKSVSLKTIHATLPSNYGTLHAEIHYDERDSDVALKVEKIIKTDLIKIINYFQYVPKNTVHFNVDPYMRLTNGNARVFQTNIINLYKFPPANEEHLITLEDWLTGLVFHEYTHVTHLDQTRDYLELGRKIFGSIAKLPANIVPRWFTEGIAVWSESHLMKGGRLHNPLFRKELLIFLKGNACKTIDCLDDPGVYPDGSLAYWAGAHFIEFLENKKAGTVKCMVEENSGQIPFFLNNAFESCAGAKAQVLFEEFRENLLKTQGLDLPESAGLGQSITNAHGSDNMQKGIILDGNTLFKVERNRDSEALVSYDLQENVNMMVEKYHYPIGDIVGITTVPNSDLEQTDQGKFLIASFHEDPRYRESNSVWKLINTETLLIEATLPLKNDPSYVIGLGNNRFITASFKDNKWLIERQKVDMAKNTSESEVLHAFGSDVNVIYLKKQGQKLFLKLNRKELGTALYVSDLTLDKLFKVYESKDLFDIPVLNENFLVLREGEKLKMVEFPDGLKKIAVGDLGKDTLNHVTFAEINDERAVFIENSLKTKAMPLKDSLNYLKKTASKFEVQNLVTVDFKDEVAKSAINNGDVESFPKFYHMLPHYWFLAVGSSENLSSIGAMTTFVDPMELNILDATILSYPSESKFGGSLNFAHKFSGVTDQWSAAAFVNHEYTKTDFSAVINRTTETQLSTRYAFLMKRWTMIPGVYFGTTKTLDFISERNIQSAGVNAVVNYNAASFDDYFQSLTLQLKSQNDNPNRGKNYLNTQAMLQAEARFHERLIAGIKTSYGKLKKTGFQQGVLYAGGTTDISNRRWHEFYGLPYSNAYGNEIFTFRAYLDITAWYVYRGINFVPLYLKEAHLIVGGETLSADRIILGNQIFRNESIQSVFFGPRLKMNMFYYVPVDVDLIYSNIKKPNGGNVSQVEFSVNADLF